VKILVVDHEDSFVYNLCQALADHGRVRVRCVRYTEPLETVRRWDPDGFVFSPGPGHPADRKLTGLARAVLDRYSAERPVLGVCLGHQLIGAHFGARVGLAARPVHGETERVWHTEDSLYRGLPSPFRAARYHSLVVARAGLPRALEVTARTRRGVVMGLRHRRRPVHGVQFHPESYLTEAGDRLLANFRGELRR
jgi:anthranilate synthase/aminodeoxychorismate synthase-like glutamine amidotransferase